MKEEVREYLGTEEIHRGWEGHNEEGPWSAGLGVGEEERLPNTDL